MKYFVHIAFIFTLLLSGCYQVRQVWKIDEAKKASAEMVHALKRHMRKTGKPCFIFVKEFDYDKSLAQYKNNSPLAQYIIDGLAAEKVKFIAYNNNANITEEKYSVSPGTFRSPNVLLYGTIHVQKKNTKNKTQQSKFLFLLELKELRTKKTIWQTQTSFF